MQIIPALDLKDGCVVHATGGDRNAYLPLTNARFPSSDPIDVIKRLSHQYKCALVYLADLNAISGNHDNNAQIHRLNKEFPELELWLDSGIRGPTMFEQLRETHPAVTPILASETLDDIQLPAALLAAGETFILSLDFGAQGLLGNPGLLNRDTLPHTVIALSLSAVGAVAGPDLITVAKVRKLLDINGSAQRLVAGGGVRNRQDLVQLAASGADAALLASALYQGTLDLRRDP